MVLHSGSAPGPCPPRSCERVTRIKAAGKQRGTEQRFPPRSQQINVTRSLLSPRLGKLHQATGDRLQAARGAPREGGAPKNAPVGTQTQGGRSSGAPKSIREKMSLGLRDTCLHRAVPQLPRWLGGHGAKP